MPYRLLERGQGPGHSWANTYESLRLHTGRHMSTLPGRAFPRGTPLFPTRDEFLRYLREYASTLALAVEPGVEAREARREGGEWVVRHAGGEIRGRTLVMATGIMAKPLVPSFAGRAAFQGRVLHSVEYRRPADFTGRRVLVVGVGNSGGEIASELGRAGIDVTVLVRSGANVVPLTLGGIPIQYVGYALRGLPDGIRAWLAGRVQAAQDRRRGPPVLPRPPWRTLDAVPLIGFHLVDAIRDGAVKVKLGTLHAFERGGVRFGDGTSAEFDAVILATGFAPAIDLLGPLVRRDARGFALRSDRITSADQPNLFFVGHNYDPTGGLANIRRDSRLAARAIARLSRRP